VLTLAPLRKPQNYERKPSCQKVFSVLLLPTSKQKALGFYSKSLETTKLIYGDKHLYTAKSYHHLGEYQKAAN